MVALYAFLRTADDLVDRPDLGIPGRLQSLLQWESALKRTSTEPAEHPIFVALQDTIGKFAIDQQLLQRPLSAFKVDLFKSRYRTYGELLEYCDMSANSIGEMVLRVFGYHESPHWPDILKMSNALCSGLQLINHGQHVFEDRRVNRLYLPLEDMRAAGYNESDWHQGRCSKEFTAVMHIQFERIAKLLHDGTPVFRFVKGSLKWYLRATWWGAFRLLKKLTTHDYMRDASGPKLGYMDRIWIGLHMGRNPA